MGVKPGLGGVDSLDPSSRLIPALSQSIHCCRSLAVSTTGFGVDGAVLATWVSPASVTAAVTPCLRVWWSSFQVAWTRPLPLTKPSPESDGFKAAHIIAVTAATPPTRTGKTTRQGTRLLVDAFITGGDEHCASVTLASLPQSGRFGGFMASRNTLARAPTGATGVL